MTGVDDALGLSTKCFLRAQTPLADEIERPPLRGGTRTRDLLRDRCAIYNGLGNRRRLQSCLFTPASKTYVFRFMASKHSIES